jgi:hypothetical protein
MSATPQSVLIDMLHGPRVAQGLYVVAYLGLADLVKDGPRSAADLAAATGTHAPSLYRLLRALAGVGVFVEDGQGRFAQTPLSDCLRSDRPDGQRDLALMSGEEHYRCWGELLYSIQTGRNAFEKIYGKPVFDYLAENPRPARIFDGAMVGVHGAETAAMLEGYDFGPFGTLVDVGGGNGSLLTAVLKRYPRLHGVLFDRPDAVERARPLLAAAGVADRCRTVGGDFFREVPAGGDAYLMRHIIHDWDDEKSLMILSRCRAAMPAHGRLLVVEYVIQPGNEPSIAKGLDLTMMVIPGGQERTEAEYRTLYERSGFRLTRVVPTRHEVCVIEGIPA